MRLSLWTGLAASALVASGCASVPREQAVVLAKAGQATTAASSQSLRGVADEVGGVTERQLVRSVLARCPPPLTGTAPPACLPAAWSPEAGEADAASQNLVAVILLRTRAVNQLNAAYAAFQAEAEYDARTDLEGALTELTGTVSSLSAAVAALGGVSAAPVLAFAPIGRAIAGESAAAAQRRRLMEASKTLREIDGRLIAALTAEAQVFASISGALAETRANVSDTLLASGFTDPLPTVSEFMTRNALGAPADLDPADPRAVAVARTVLAYRARRSAAVATGAYEANIKALSALVAQHQRFEAEQDLSLAQLTYSIGELTTWVDLVAALDQPPETPAP